MRLDITFDNYVDHKLMMENMLGANTIPLTPLIDAKSKVLKKVRGYHVWDSDAKIKMIGVLFGTILK